MIIKDAPKTLTQHLDTIDSQLMNEVEDEAESKPAAKLNPTTRNSQNALSSNKSKGKKEESKLENQKVNGKHLQADVKNNQNSSGED